MKPITERTVVSLSVIALSGTMFVGGVIWAIRLEGRVNANEREVSAIVTNGKTCSDVLQNIDRRLSRIEGRLGVQ